MGLIQQHGMTQAQKDQDMWIVERDVLQPRTDPYEFLSYPQYLNKLPGFRMVLLLCKCVLHIIT